jgi:hypothetical protein
MQKLSASAATRQLREGGRNCNGLFHAGISRRSGHRAALLVARVPAQEPVRRGAHISGTRSANSTGNAPGQVHVRAGWMKRWATWAFSPGQAAWTGRISSMSALAGWPRVRAFVMRLGCPMLAAQSRPRSGTTQTGTERRETRRTVSRQRSPAAVADPGTSAWRSSFPLSLSTSVDARPGRPLHHPPRRSIPPEI